MRLPFSKRTIWKTLGPIGLAAFLSVVSAASAEATAGGDTSETPSNVVSYSEEFYAAFKPSNARDMIERTPGFALQAAQDVRGYSGAGGNVLIDGARPASKSVPLDQQLQRIPSKLVARIEVIRGAVPGIDMQGQSVLANIVRKPGATTTGSAQVMGKYYGNGFLGDVQRADVSRRTADWGVDGQVVRRHDLATDSGDGDLTRVRSTGVDAGGLRSRVLNDVVQANGAVEHRGGYGNLRVNFAAERKDIDRNDRASMTSATGSSFAETTALVQRVSFVESGAEFEHPLGESRSIKLIALQRLKDDRSRARASTLTTNQASTGNNRSRESILRGLLRQERAEGVTLEGGLEAAYNTLDARSTLTANGLAVILPSATVQVEERRAEAFATVTAALMPRVTLESGLRVERSTISQSGGSVREKTLTFPKPRLIVAWNLGSFQTRLRAERVVGQLDFNDFAATSELDLGTSNAGNADIEPERSWLTEVAVERRFWKGGAVVVSYSRAQVERVVDLIPIASVFDAPGNIGSGTRNEIKAGLTLPLERLGVDNAQLRFNGTWRTSSVSDPVVGKSRRISAERPFEGELFLTKSFPQFRSTAALEGTFGFRETTYRINEIRSLYEAPSWKLYWDWSPRPDVSIRIQTENFSDRLRARDRTTFVGSRASGIVGLQEHRSAYLSRIFMLRARMTF